MGKSPGKWIKTVLFAKKLSRSHSSKGRNASKVVGKKEAAECKGLPASPVISQPSPINAARNDSTAQGRAPSPLATDAAILPSINQDATVIATTELITPGKIREEKAAVKAQAAFRGYLARRAFRALLGIIRLQALIRGHLVRRQAVATLHCLQGIVKVQALIRGRHVRLSGIGSAVYTKLLQAKFLDTRQVSRHGANKSTQKGCLVVSSNPFICKLLTAKTIALPLQMCYVQDEPNSVWNWLERWTHTCFWKPLPQPKKIANLRSQTRIDGYAMETGSGRSKRTARRNFPFNTNTETMNNMVKHNFKKVTCSSAETFQEHPQNELEKVKHNLRKVSNSVAQMPDQAETEVEKSMHGKRRVSNLATDVSKIEVVNSVEKMKKNGVLLASDANPEIQSRLETTSLTQPQVEAASVPSTGTQLLAESTPTISSESKQNMDAGATEQLEADIPVNLPIGDQFSSEQQPVHGFVKNKKHTSLNVEKPSNEEQTFKDSQKISKRRASLSAKTEFKEDGIQDTQTLPSYMAATESAKAKLRGLSSPRISADGIEKSGTTRRHSLPSSTNGRLNTLSSQTQKQVQTKLTNDRGGIRNDRSHGLDKPMQVEWRR